MAHDPTAPERPSLWIRRSVFGARFDGQGWPKDTGDRFTRLSDDLTARVYCSGCKEIGVVTMHDPDTLQAWCECGRAFEVEAD